MSLLWVPPNAGKCTDIVGKMRSGCNYDSSRRDSSSMIDSRQERPDADIMTTKTLQIQSVKDAYPCAQRVQDLLEVRDPSVGLQAFIALDDLGNGPGFGGIRRMVYGSQDEAATDTCQLAAQMTTKTRFAKLACGGAKAVIMELPGADTEALYTAFGRAVDSLDGAYVCGPDVGTGEEDMDVIRSVTRHANAAGNRPAFSTARGVLAGIRAALDFHIADHSTQTVSAFVHGVGRVGSLVAQGVSHLTRELLLADVNQARLKAVQEQIGTRCPVTVVPPYSKSYNYWPGTLFSPCAIGPVVTEANVDTLACSIICGSANTQLERDEFGLALHKRGILYIPDFVVNAGAVIEGALTYLATGPDTVVADIDEAIDGIGERVAALLTLSSVRHCAPLQVVPDFLSRG